MKTAKFLLVFAACAVLYRVFEPVYQAETPYSRSEFEQVSSFLLYKRQHLEAYVRYCAQQNYRLEKMPAAFELQHARQIKAADDFVFRFQPQERRAFYAELNRAYAEMEPEMLDKLEQSYNQNRQIYESAGQSFSRYEFCQWLDNHPEILFKGKTDKEFDNN